MDSGNSGSMSSSGDEEYESRTESIPSFINLNPSSSSSSTSSSTHHFIASSESNPSLLSHHHLFDLSPSNYLQPNSSNPNFLLNLDSSTALRSRSSLRPDHHQHHQPYQLGPPSSSSTPHHHHHHQSVLASHHYAAGPSAIHLQQPETNPGALRSGTAAATTTTTTTTASTTSVVRSSKKRTRASRRAPTTVLTTDTSNFRAMVQEFTGIPAPPFSGSSLSFSRRLDLFGSGSAIGRSSGGASPLDGPLYPLRPSAQKPQTSPFGNIASSSSSSSPLFSNVMVDATNINPSSLNFQPSSSDHHHHQGLMNKQPRNMLNMQNPGINIAFQSLPLHPNSLNMAGFGEKQGQGSHLAMCTTTSALNHDQELNASYQRSGIDSNPVASDMWRVDGAGSGDSCKLNYAAAAATNSAEFQTEKGMEINVSNTRNEGTVDPWIFPSD